MDVVYLVAMNEDGERFLRVHKERGWICRLRLGSRSS